MFLKPVWVDEIHGVGVYATPSVRIWGFRNKFSLFQLRGIIFAEQIINVKSIFLKLFKIERPLLKNQEKRKMTQI